MFSISRRITLNKVRVEKYLNDKWERNLLKFYKQYELEKSLLRILDTYPVHYIKKYSDQIRSDQSLSRVWLFATPWIAARQASLSITNSRSSLRLTSIESVMPFSHPILCRPLPLLPSVFLSISLFQWVSFSHQWPKYWNFSFHHQSFQWIFRVDSL